MVKQETFIELASSFPDVTIEPHFENTAFKIKKKIFATINPKANRVCVKLNAIDQGAFSAFDNTIIYPVPNKWGKMGWTNIELSKVKKSVVADALKTAYNEVLKGKQKG
jgi:predicted DNA-binding protein (MmcQ/YjbR family)